mgnify:CR=1 FL=1
MPSLSRSQSLAPLLLRLALGVTFLWAGMGKLFAEFEVSGARAARLANWGALERPPAPPPEVVPPAVVPPGGIPTPSGTAPNGRPVPREPLPPAEPGTGRIRPVYAQTDYTAADFPSPVRTRRVNGIALMLHQAANPAPREDGTTPMALWPAFAAGGRMPVYLAWAVAITELAGGGMLILGLFTRLAALGIAGTMLGAVWLTEIGPAIQSGKTILGVLPARADLYAIALAPDGYVTLLWQAALLAGALAIVLLGSGALAIDNAMRSAPPAPKPAPKPAA